MGRVEIQLQRCAQCDGEERRAAERPSAGLGSQPGQAVPP